MQHHRDVLAFPEPAKLSAGTENVPAKDLVVVDSPRIAGENPEHIGMLTELEVPLPPIVVHRATMHVIDGVHRLRAAVLRGDEIVEVRFFDGNEADAFVLAVQLNSAHGLPLSLADRLAAAERIIGSHPQWSDRRIAKIAGLAPNTVGAIRRRSTAQDGQSNNRVGADGRVRPRDSTVGRQLAGDIMRKNPGISLRQAARAAGISAATASDVRARLNRGESPVPLRRRAPTQLQGNTQQRTREVLAADQTRSRPVVSADVIRNLTRDPSLRYTDAGKVLLRALGFCALGPDEWNRIIEAVPPHHTETVAHLAKGCAGMWLDFADRLVKRRASTTSNGARSSC